MARLRKDPQEPDARMFAFPFLLLPAPPFAQYSQMALTLHCRVFRNIKLPLSCRLGLSSSRICKVHLQNVPDMVAARL